MINKIKYTEALKPFITHECEENKIFVSMADDIPKNNYLVIKVDRYYNSLKLSDTPPSVDCLVLLKCTDNHYVLFLVELKKIKRPRSFKIDNIRGKFRTTIDDFMSTRFKDIFHSETLPVKELHLYFVTNLYKTPRKDTTRMDSLLSLKPFKFRGRNYQISHKHPNPLIKNC